MSERTAALIRQDFPLRPVAGLGHIQLHLATPQSRVSRLARGAVPYWAFCWGGGLALAHHLLAEPGAVAGRRVLDLGAGSGLVAIAAALAGAGSVVAADTDPDALVASGFNAVANGIVLEARGDDLLDGPEPQVDVILAGDVFYDAALARRMVPFLDRAAAAGVEVLVGDPYRKPLPLHRLTPLATFEVADFGDGAGHLTEAGVFIWTSG